MINKMKRITILMLLNYGNKQIINHKSISFYQNSSEENYNNYNTEDNRQPLESDIKVERILKIKINLFY